MADTEYTWLQHAIEAATNLATAVGVPGAALLIVSLGVAFRIDSIVATLRGMAKDIYDFQLQKAELRHKMRMDGERLEADARRELQLATTQKGSET